MIMDNLEIGARRSRRPVRYCVTALLMVMTAACMLLAVFRPLGSYSVTAYLKVVQPLASFGTRLSPQEIERAAMASLTLATSAEVINAALANPGVAKLDVIKQQPNPAVWLRDRLRPSFPGEGEILEIRLSGVGNGAKNDELILDAVVDAYKLASDRKNRLAKPDELTSDVTLMQKSSVTLQSR